MSERTIVKFGHQAFQMPASMLFWLTTGLLGGRALRVLHWILWDAHTRDLWPGLEDEPTDRIVAAPSWIDPIVRHHLGDLLSLRLAAPSDLAGIERVWEVGIRGATTRAETRAALRSLGRLRRSPRRRRE